MRCCTTGGEPAIERSVGQLAAEVGVDHAAREYGAGARVAERRPLRILVLAPRQAARYCDEQQHCQQRADREVPAVGDAATGEGVFDVPGFARERRMVVATGTKSTVLTLVEESPRAGTLRLRHPTKVLR